MTNKKDKVEFIHLKKVKQQSAKPGKISRDKRPFNPGILVLSFLLCVLIIRMIFLIYTDIANEYVSPSDMFDEWVTDCDNRLGYSVQTSNDTMICDIGCNRHYYEIVNYNASKINDTYTTLHRLIIMC